MSHALKHASAYPSAPFRVSGHVAAMIALGTSGVVTFLAMPVVVAAMVADLGASERDVGLFSTIQLINLSAGCLVSTFLPRGEFRRFGLAAIATMLVCDALCLFNPDWTAFLILRGVGGAAGGVAVSQATAAMSQTDNPERNFGLFLALQTLVSIVCIYAMPALIAIHGFFWGYGVFVVFDLAALLAMAFFASSQAGASANARLTGNDRGDWWRSFSMLASILSFFTGIGAIWTFLAIMGSRIDLADSQVSMVLSLSKLVAFAASFLPGLLLIKLGRRLPVFGSVSMLLAAVFVFAVSDGIAPFVLATIMFSAGWYVLYPFQLGALGSVDKDGRPMLAAAALTGAGLGIGPALTVTAGDGLEGIYMISAAAFALAGLLAIPALAKASLPETVRSAV